MTPHAQKKNTKIAFDLSFFFKTVRLLSDCTICKKKENCVKALVTLFFYLLFKGIYVIQLCQRYKLLNCS